LKPEVSDAALGSYLNGLSAHVIVSAPKLEEGGEETVHLLLYLLNLLQFPHMMPDCSCGNKYADIQIISWSKMLINKSRVIKMINVLPK
jgi:hypothetical protein